VGRWKVVETEKVEAWFAQVDEDVQVESFCERNVFNSFELQKLGGKTMRLRREI